MEWPPLFRSFLGRFALFFALVPVVLLLELLDAAGRIDDLHFAGEERMASRANLDRDVLLGAAGYKLVAATASHRGFNIFGVNSGFHDFLLAYLTDTLL